MVKVGKLRQIPLENPVLAIKKQNLRNPLARATEFAMSRKANSESNFPFFGVKIS